MQDNNWQQGYYDPSYYGYYGNGNRARGGRRLKPRKLRTDLGPDELQQVPHGNCLACSRVQDFSRAACVPQHGSVGAVVVYEHSLRRMHGTGPALSTSLSAPAPAHVLTEGAHAAMLPGRSSQCVPASA